MLTSCPGSDILAAVHQNLPPTKTTLLHTHSTYISAVTTLADNEVKMHNLRALRFDGRIAYQPRTPSSGVQLAELLSTTKDILFLANGGSIIVGTSISSALEDLVSLEAVCKNQIIAMSTGAPLVTVSNETRASYKAICTDAIKKSGWCSKYFLVLIYLFFLLHHFIQCLCDIWSGAVNLRQTICCISSSNARILAGICTRGVSSF